MTTNNQTIEAQIQANGKAPRVTPADIEANIASEHYFTAGFAVTATGTQAEAVNPALDLLTFCVLVLHNGTKVVGINYGAIDPAQHSAEMGRQEARKQAIEKVWELLGFRLRDRLAGD